MPIALPDFMARILGFAEKSESNFQAAALLATANAEIVTLKAEIATLKTAATDGSVTINKLTVEKTDLTQTVATHAATITTLTAELATAKGTANATIAGQGLDPALIPAAAVSAPIPGAGETAWQKYQRLGLTSSREAGAFWAANADEILRTRTA